MTNGQGSRNALGSLRREVLMDLASVACGAYKGYCDAKGIEIDNEMVERGLIFGPTVVHALYGYINGAKFDEKEMGFGERMGGAARGMGFGAIRGAVETGIGYGLGYFANVLES